VAPHTFFFLPFGAYAELLFSTQSCHHGQLFFFPPAATPRSFLFCGKRHPLLCFETRNSLPLYPPSSGTGGLLHVFTPFFSSSPF